MDIGKDSSQKLTDLNYELGDGSFPLAQQLAEVSPAVLENFGEDTEALATLSPYKRSTLIALVNCSYRML